MYLIRKSYKVEYAHQLLDAYTSCCHKTIHGHSALIEVFLSSDELDKNGMVIDFGEVSAIIKKYIMDTYDHALIMPDEMNPEYLGALKHFNEKLVIWDGNPTAECFAEKIYWDVGNLLEPVIEKHNRVFQIWSVRFHETDSGYAEFMPVKIGNDTGCKCKN